MMMMEHEEPVSGFGVFGCPLSSGRLKLFEVGMKDFESGWRRNCGKRKNFGEAFVFLEAPPEGKGNISESEVGIPSATLEFERILLGIDPHHLRILHKGMIDFGFYGDLRRMLRVFFGRLQLKMKEAFLIGSFRRPVNYNVGDEGVGTLGQMEYVLMVFLSVITQLLLNLNWEVGCCHSIFHKEVDD